LLRRNNKKSRESGEAALELNFFGARKKSPRKAIPALPKVGNSLSLQSATFQIGRRVMRYKLMTAAFAAAAAFQFSVPAQATDLEVIHWWTSKGESRAVAEFAKAFDNDGQGDHWVDSAIALGQTARATVMQRVLGGDGNGWQIKGAFDQILLYKIGIPKMEQMYGKKDVDIVNSEGVKDALTELKELKPYTDNGYANRNWNDTTNLVITGKAGLQIMGDWARGEFAAAGMTGVKDFGCMIGLDEDNPIVSTDGDVVVFPKQKDPDKEAAQKRLAALLISPKVQVAFNNAKGSMPVRGDVDMATADPCMQKALKAVDDPKRIATGVQRFITEDTSNQLNSLITQYWADDSMTADAAQKKFADIIKNSD
jgi:ABC-type glycerol-3-phosphate transport system substrate-binding protein